MSFLLNRIDSNPIDEEAPECRALIVLRNEMLRLPWLLDYYRAQGVTRFFVIDNGSDDGSVEFLLQQNDCHIFVTQDSYSAAQYGVAWRTWLLNQFYGNHWWVIVDADEILVYPGSEHTKLPEFCCYLDSVGAEGLYTLMLDMYSKNPVAEAVYQSTQPFFDVCPYFDTEYTMYPRLKAPLAPEPFPPKEPVGGPRHRRFYPEFQNHNRKRLARVKAIRRLRNVLRNVGIRLNIDCPVPPMMFKVPLLKWRPGISLINSHVITPVKLAPVTGALLHFKFFADFHESLVREVARRQRFDGSSEYARYLKMVEADPRMSFYYEKSAEYSGTEQLVKLGLMNDDLSFENYRIAGAKS